MIAGQVDGLAFTVDVWDDRGVSLVQCLATAANHAMARAAFDAALLGRPGAYITLRHGARVIARSARAEVVDGMRSAGAAIPTD